MKLVAQMIVRNELDRYLEPCVFALLEFVDELRIVDNGSTDGTAEFLAGIPAARVLEHDEQMFRNEGRARNVLLDWTLEAEADWVLTLDADELVADGALLRSHLESGLCDRPAVTLCMQEVWEAEPERFFVRVDGGWRSHEIASLWKPPDRRRRGGEWRIVDRALACGREPIAVRRFMQTRQYVIAGIEILHFGWANPAERKTRAARYAEHDGGKFHAGSHLESILWRDERVKLCESPAPPSSHYREFVTRSRA